MTDNKYQIKDYINNFSDDLLNLEVDEAKLKEIFPDINNKLQDEKNKPKFILEKKEGISDELSFVQELISENYNKMNEDQLKESNNIYVKKPSVIINLKNKNQQIITNYSIINFHDITCDGHTILQKGEFYIVVAISRAAQQAGSLGIWDTRMNDWCFTHSDEGFCPSSIKYHLNDDTFSVSSSCYYYGKGAIDEEYLINQHKKIKLIKEL